MGQILSVGFVVTRRTSFADEVCVDSAWKRDRDGFFANQTELVVY